jgi:hypothetical protein
LNAKEFIIVSVGFGLNVPPHETDFPVWNLKSAKVNPQFSAEALNRNGMGNYVYSSFGMIRQYLKPLNLNLRIYVSIAGVTDTR